MKRLRNRPIGTAAFFAVGTAAIALALLAPRATHADEEEIPDWERQGDYEQNGTRFGEVVVKGELVPAANAPGGWTLVRTLENTSDEPQNCTVEERILRMETTPYARSGSMAEAVVLRNQPIALKPHEKRTIGITLPPKIGEQITAGLKKKAWIDSAYQRAVANEKYDDKIMAASYNHFSVEYLKPLPPGKKAQSIIFARGSMAGPDAMGL
jgi:hypothetical protein